MRDSKSIGLAKIKGLNIKIKKVEDVIEFYGLGVVWSEGPLDLDWDGKRERDVWKTDVLNSLQRKL